MSGTMNGSGLLEIGKQCSHPACSLVDFLPFKCQYCTSHFCQEHFNVSTHNCSKYDEAGHNRIVPKCPLCNTPVTVRPGQDPNIRMEEHFDKECSVMTGRESKIATMPRCARSNCKKVLFSPICCDKCREQFCPSHRFPSDHNCSTQPAPASRIRVKPLSGPNTAKSVAGKMPSVGISAFGAFKKIVATSSSSGVDEPSLPPLKPMAATASSSSTNSNLPFSSHSNPFSKTDRRARAERESRLKAMQARAQKGLLREDEKAILAAEEEMSKDKECVLM